MVKKKRKIQWNKQVTRSLIEAIAYIRKDSPQNADKVNKEILSKSESWLNGRKSIRQINTGKIA